MGSLMLLMGLTLVVAVVNTNAGGFNPSHLLMMQKSGAQLTKPPSKMNDDELFSIFFKDSSYLLKPEEVDPPEDDEEEEGVELVKPGQEEFELEEDGPEDYIDGTRRSLVRVGDNSIDEYDDYEDDYGEGRSKIGNIGKQVIKQIGKVGLSMLKRGMKFLKSMFFKFGGKRLLKRAKEYLKKNAFSINPIDCVNTTCETCAVFNLPFKIKSYKACAKMGFVRNRGKTNFTVDFNVLKKNMFHRSFEVGDLANCYEFQSEPDAEYPIASLIGKVCVQGFEFKIDSKTVKNEEGKPKRKGKFCLALVFKRWATGYRFCVERAEKKKKATEKGKELLDKGKELVGKLRPGKKGAGNETQKSQGKMRDKNTGKLVWKVELKKIAAGEQENQIVGDKTLFKGESQKRQRDAAKDLGSD